MKKFFGVLPVLLVLLSCGPSTKIVQSWRDPAVTVDASAVHKFVVAVLVKNEALRRRAEDKMVARNPGKAVQSYIALGPAELKESDDFYMGKLRNDGYDGVVILRMVKVDKETRYVPGSYPAYYGSWRGYYGAAWGGFYDPGYVTTDKTYYVEVNVYSVPKDKLVWSGVTSTVNPANGEQMIDEVMDEVQHKMKQEGFLKTSGK